MFSNVFPVVDFYQLGSNSLVNEYLKFDYFSWLLDRFIWDCFRHLRLHILTLFWTSSLGVTIIITILASDILEHWLIWFRDFEDQRRIIWRIDCFHSSKSSFWRELDWSSRCVKMTCWSWLSLHLRSQFSTGQEMMMIMISLCIALLLRIEIKGQVFVLIASWRYRKRVGPQMLLVWVVMIWISSPLSRHWLILLERLFLVSYILRWLVNCIILLQFIPHLLQQKALVLSISVIRENATSKILGCVNGSLSLFSDSAWVDASVRVPLRMIGILLWLPSLPTWFALLLLLAYSRGAQYLLSLWLHLNLRLRSGLMNECLWHTFWLGIRSCVWLCNFFNRLKVFLGELWDELLLCWSGRSANVVWRI